MMPIKHYYLAAGIASLHLVAAVIVSAYYFTPQSRPPPRPDLIPLPPSELIRAFNEFQFTL